MGEGLDLASIIDDNETHTLMIANIKEAIRRAFDDAFNYTNIFETYIHMYLENNTMGNIILFFKNFI